MSRMFRSIDHTWHIYTGCGFQCSYCYARGLIEGRLRHLAKYERGFEPTFHPEELKKKFRPGDFIGVALMSDVSFAAPEEVSRIMERISQFPDTRFLLQSKDPACFASSEWLMRDNAVYGTTLETNRDHYSFSKAPDVSARAAILRMLPAKHKFVSIEPIMDFDLEEMVSRIALIKPEIVEVGSDNYRNCLPEPPWSKVEALLKALREFVPKVVEKEGLERLR